MVLKTTSLIRSSLEYFGLPNLLDHTIHNAIFPFVAQSKQGNPNYKCQKGMEKTKINHHAKVCAIFYQQRSH